MIKTQEFINILEEIKNTFNTENWQENGLKETEKQIKIFKFYQSKKYNNLKNKQQKYLKKYGMNGRKTIRINKEIDNRLKKIYNSCY